MGYLLKIIVAVSHFSKGVIGYTLYRKTIKPEELRLRYDTFINSWDLLTVNHWVQQYTTIYLLHNVETAKTRSLLCIYCTSIKQNPRVCKQRSRRISTFSLTRTFMNRLSSSSRSGIGGFVRFLVEGCRTWLLLVDATGPSNIVGSLDVIKPILHKITGTTIATTYSGHFITDNSTLTLKLYNFSTDHITFRGGGAPQRVHQQIASATIQNEESDNDRTKVK